MIQYTQTPQLNVIVTRRQYGFGYLGLHAFAQQILLGTITPQDVVAVTFIGQIAQVPATCVVETTTLRVLVDNVEQYSFDMTQDPNA